jgi:aminoglycoside 2''-phosphotransferase
LYRGSIERCFPRIQIRAWKPILEGWDSIVVEVNGELLFKFPRRPEVRAQLEKEGLLLPELGKVLPLPVPRILFVGTVDGTDDTQFIGYRKIDGVELTAQLASSASGQRLALELSGFLSELHRFPVREALRLRVPDLGSKRWQQEYRGYYDQQRREVFPLLERSAKEKAHALWNGFLSEKDNFRFRPALIHRDLVGEHVLCDPDRGSVAGVIDWGDAAIGDPAIDFAGLLLDCGGEFAQRVLTAYEGEVDHTFWSRAVFYARIVGGLEALYGLLVDDQSHIQRGLERLHRDLSSGN